MKFKKVLENIKEHKRSFLEKEDLAASMGNPDEWFTGDNSWLTFVGIMVIVAALMAPLLGVFIVKHFGLTAKFQKMNSTIGRMLGTMRKMSKAAPLVSLPICEATHTGYSTETLGISDLDLFVMCLKVIVVSTLVYLIYRLVKKICMYVNLYNLAHLQTKLTWSSLLILNKTDMYFQIYSISHATSIDLYLGSYFGNPEDVICEGQFVEDSVILDKQTIFDFVEINWETCALSLKDLDLQLPSQIKVPLFYKFIVRKLFNIEDAHIRVVAYNQMSKKIRPVTSDHKIHSEIVFSIDGRMVEVSEVYEDMEPGLPETNNSVQPVSKMKDISPMLQTVFLSDVQIHKEDKEETETD